MKEIAIVNMLNYQLLIEKTISFIYINSFEQKFERKTGLLSRQPDLIKTRSQL